MEVESGPEGAETLRMPREGRRSGGQELDCKEVRQVPPFLSLRLRK